MFSSRLSSIFCGGGGANAMVLRSKVLPTLNLTTNKEIYSPSDLVVITVEIRNPNPSSNGDSALSLLLECLGFEITGLQKLDGQWFAHAKLVSGSK